MCLGMPARIIEIVDAEQCLTKVDMSGTERVINTAIVDKSDDPAGVGDWVLVHLGMALEKIDEEEANETTALFEQLAGPGPDGEDDDDGRAEFERLLFERRPV